MITGDARTLTMGWLKAERAKLLLEPRAAVLARLEARAAELEAKPGRDELETFAAGAGRRAARYARGVTRPEHVLMLVSTWSRLSLSEPNDDRRAVLIEMGAVLFATDFGVGM